MTTPPFPFPGLAEVLAWAQGVHDQLRRGELTPAERVALLAEVRRAKRESSAALQWAHDFALLACREPEDDRASLRDLAAVFSATGNRDYTRGPAARISRVMQHYPTAEAVLRGLERAVERQAEEQ